MRVALILLLFVLSSCFLRDTNPENTKNHIQNNENEYKFCYFPESKYTEISHIKGVYLPQELGGKDYSGHFELFFIINKNGDIDFCFLNNFKIKDKNKQIIIEYEYVNLIDTLLYYNNNFEGASGLKYNFSDRSYPYGNFFLKYKDSIAFKINDFSLFDSLNKYALISKVFIINQKYLEN